MKKFILNAVVGVVLASSGLVAGDYVFFSPQMISSHLTDYGEEEKMAIEQDLGVVRSICLQEIKENRNQRKPVYLATAGAPGARKTTILERFIKDHPSFSEVAYIDPDQRTLKFMAHTYHSQSLSARSVATYPDYALATKAAYEKWRGGSNYIALTLLEEAFDHSRDIAHGTTSTGAHIPNFLSKVKNAGYEIVLLLCSCEDSFRRQSIQYRNDSQKFYQSTPEDGVSKGKFFSQRMSAYFTYADTLYLFWSDDLSTPERLSAIFADGSLKIVDREAFNRFISKFDADRVLLEREGQQIPSWNELVNLYRNRF